MGEEGTERFLTAHRHDMPEPRAAHWDGVYETSDPTRVSWYEPRPAVSLRLIQGAGLEADAPILDVGGGTSTLVDELLDAGHSSVGVLDVSERALNLARARLGARAERVEWFRGDVTGFRARHPWALWHDRAVLHFLTDPADHQAYRERLRDALSPGGVVVLATFGPQGPTRCSGLDCRRYAVAELVAFLGPDFRLEEHLTHRHSTPSGSVQQFLYARFRRNISSAG